MATVSTAWRIYATQLQPALATVWALGGPPAWLSLAMAAHESGVPPFSNSTYVLAQNPWGVACWSGSAEYQCGDGGFVIYPSLQDAATNFVQALGPNRLVYRNDPVAFMDELQESGWDATNTPTYADSVLYTWGPYATAALAAIGADDTTGVIPPSYQGSSVAGSSTSTSGSSATSTTSTNTVPSNYPPGIGLETSSFPWPLVLTVGAIAAVVIVSEEVFPW